MLNPEQRRYLLDVARRSITHGIVEQRPLPLNLEQVPGPLLQPAATFVTLEVQRHLRGCIGSLEAHRPLAIDVAENAYAAAFRDPRFSPLTVEELPVLEIHISVLSRPEALPISSEAELLTKLRPGVDGLILQEGARRATFLPSVWESLKEPARFVEQLKLKGGWRRDHWSQDMNVFLYQTEQFGEG